MVTLLTVDDSSVTLIVSGRDNQRVNKVKIHRVQGAIFYVLKEKNKTQLKCALILISNLSAKSYKLTKGCIHCEFGLLFVWDL